MNSNPDIEKFLVGIHILKTGYYESIKEALEILYQRYFEILIKYSPPFFYCGITCTTSCRSLKNTKQ